LNDEKKQFLSGLASGIFIAYGFGTLLTGTLNFLGLYTNQVIEKINPVYLLISGGITLFMGIMLWRNKEKKLEDSKVKK